MTSALFSHGWEVPIGGSVVSGGASGTICTFVLRDTDGVPQPGINLSGAGVVRISTDGGATFNNRAGAAPTSIEHGIYNYTLDNTEAAFNYVLVQVILAGYGLVLERVDITDPQLVAVDIDIKNAITASSDASTAAVLGAVTTIDAHTDTAITASNVHIDASIAAAVTTIDTHTDTATAAETVAVNAHTDSAVASINAHTDVEAALVITNVNAHTDGAVTGVIIDNAAIATAVWDALVSGHSNINTFGDAVRTGLGLMQNNFFIDNVVQDPSGNGQVYCRMRLFPDSNTVLNATDGGIGEGEFATYEVTTTYTGPNKIRTYTARRIDD